MAGIHLVMYLIEKYLFLYRQVLICLNFFVVECYAAVITLKSSNFVHSVYLRALRYSRDNTFVGLCLQHKYEPNFFYLPHNPTYEASFLEDRHTH